MTNFSNKTDIVVYFSFNPDHEINLEDAAELVNTLWPEFKNKQFIEKTDIIAFNILTKSLNIIHNCNNTL